MSRRFFKPYKVHNCFDQTRILAHLTPFDFVHLKREELLSLIADIAQKLGEVRPEPCRCKYRITAQQATDLIHSGLAEYLINDWQPDESGKKLVPVHSWHLVWSKTRTTDLNEVVDAAVAKQTPRVQTIEKAHIERAYVAGDKEELERIDEWGRLALDVTNSLIVPFIPDPFEGCAVLNSIGSGDQRSKISDQKRRQKELEKELDKSKRVCENISGGEE